MNRERLQRTPVLRRSSFRWATLLSGCFLILAARSLPALQGSETEPAPPQSPRRLVLCLDGTWNSAYDEKYSNVFKLCRSALPLRASQIAYYDIGVGALGKYPGTANRLLHLADRFLGGAWGAGFESNIEDALEFLVLNHREGDEVFVFGFSRGAATARGLTHFLDWAGGIPTRRDAYYFPQLFSAYVLSRGKRDRDSVVAEINKTRMIERLPPLDPFQSINIEFLGVRDTVMALKSRFRAARESTSPVSHSFYISDRPARCVKHARQALAVDEARYDFRPEIWQGSSPGQTLEQRWFAGVHSNVGGGYPRDGLANLAFQWILREAMACGLEIDRDFTRLYRPFPADHLYKSYSLPYRILDWLRFRSGRGKRNLLAPPATANLSLDPSVIRRIETDPEERNEKGEPRFPYFGKPYRPENVLQFLACQPDLEQYLQGLGFKAKELQLPGDALKQVGELKARNARKCRGAIISLSASGLKCKSS